MSPPSQPRGRNLAERESGVLEKLVRQELEQESRSFAPRWGDERIEDLIFRFEVGDYLGALSLSDALLGARPARLVPADVAHKMGLDPKEGLVFDLIDGASCIEDVFEASGLTLVDALRSLCSLAQKGVMALR
jgi:hypothetical protein